MRSKPYRFRLYIVGGQVGSQRAEPDLREALDAFIAGSYELDVIDVRARPDLAEADRVVAAPTVIRLDPPPLRRAIGALSDVSRVAAALGLSSSG